MSSVKVKPYLSITVKTENGFVDVTAYDPRMTLDFLAEQVLRQAGLSLSNTPGGMVVDILHNNKSLPLDATLGDLGFAGSVDLELVRVPRV